MKRGHLPERTCRGCGRKAPGQELLRLVLAHGELAEDIEQNAPGRGVYCCKNINCRKRLEKNKKVLKLAFRLQG
ncbi:MAG: DUF448 domain-containing protein [Desulfobulbaceae bacterium]|nr:DUF448 domain-containing protein [Desulfobulbaceae bacterium]